MEETRGASKKQRREAKHALDVLPKWAWLLVLRKMSPYDHLAFGLTCRTFLEAVREVNPKKKLKTDLTDDKLCEQMPCFSMGWFQWVLRSFERRKGGPKTWRDEEEESYGHLYDSDLMKLAAFQGSKKAMEWLVSQGIPLKIKRKYSESGDNEVVAVGGAAAGGHIAVLEWLRSKGCEFDESTCYFAALGGHLHVLQWLRSQDPPCDWDEGTCYFAAMGGHLDVLQWARSQDPPCPWNKRTCEEAAGGGHLHVLQWLRSQDPPCDWDEGTCSCAAEGGHLHVLQWLRSQDPPCDWDELTCSCAAEGGHLHVLQWARSQDPPCDWIPEDCIEYAVERRDQHVVEWIEANFYQEQ
ncbi:hypothetical protein A3770_10p57810 [Chloropicon primus]|uniref:F-box domain-containing protein n=1 Tax=Chloropicon primus TaxID=1764295 RepID=A0A5B8MS34_9CHLO|nr:hypothetical protein A3770_10p57810 [Chloropicon primus]|eukprot:QDZ23263.1 hypothetical protein A3770_10p57810 [Chloropicon primus]